MFHVKQLGDKNEYENDRRIHKRLLHLDCFCNCSTYKHNVYQYNYNGSKNFKNKKRHNKLIRGVNNTNLEGIIDSYYEKIDYQLQENDLLKQQINKLNEKVKFCVQKTGFIRYKAFENVGSDMSFSLALLDENDDGIIMTSLYSRNESTMYAKSIEKGKSKYELSEEEKKALYEAIKKDL